MEKFWNALKLELKAYIHPCCDTEIKPNNNAFLIMRDYPFSKIHTRVLSIKPSKSIPHHIDVDEVWSGEDSEGSPWSDSITGTRYDLSDMSINRAAQMLVHWMRKDYTEFFK